VGTLDSLAELTWDRLHDGPKNNIFFREESLTEHNLFELARRHPGLAIRKFSTTEEAGTGADWEWWIGSDIDGWIGMRIQAKKLDRGRYRELRYRSQSQIRIQCEVLIDETLSQSRGRALYPFYCFYNGWDRTDGWPSDVAWTAGCSLPPECSTVPNLKVFGCALAPAEVVLGTLRTDPNPLSQAAMLPHQEIERRLDAIWAGAERRTDRRRFHSLPSYADAAREERWQPGLAFELRSIVPTSYVVVDDLGPTLEQQRN
jgi:hypothetical protein